MSLNAFFKIPTQKWLFKQQKLIWRKNLEKKNPFFFFKYWNKMRIRVSCSNSWFHLAEFSYKETNLLQDSRFKMCIFCNRSCLSASRKMISGKNKFRHYFITIFLTKSLKKLSKNVSNNFFLICHPKNFETGWMKFKLTIVRVIN